MKLTIGAIAALYLLPSALAQNTIKKDVESAIVWSGAQCQKSDTLLGGHEPVCDGVPTAHPEASSIVQDPLTGNSLRKISYEPGLFTSLRRGSKWRARLGKARRTCRRKLP